MPFSIPGDLLDPGTEPTSPALESGFFTTDPPGKPFGWFICITLQGSLFLSVRSHLGRRQGFFCMGHIYIEHSPLIHLLMRIATSHHLELNSSHLPSVCSSDPSHGLSLILSSVMVRREVTFTKIKPLCRTLL